MPFGICPEPIPVFSHPFVSLLLLRKLQRFVSMAIILDPSVFRWSSTRVVGANGEGGVIAENRQLVTVARPIIGFRFIEYRVESLEGRCVPFDGKKHEKAIVRI